ncbi:MAG: PilZ domain-containing protein [Acidobacteriota bacterium]|nr:PilZ domain-containing protein [Acidobacteriota bacterium]
MADQDEMNLWLPGLGPDAPTEEPTLGRSTSRIQVLDGGQRGSGSSAAFQTQRRSVRLPPARTRWSDIARLRPGFEARIVDIAAHGLLLEVAIRLHIGGRVDLLLATADSERRLEVTGSVRRCYVASLNPVVYRGAVEFDREIELLVLGPVAVPNILSA